MPSTTNAPLLSIIMPVYNSEQYVAEAIESILSQSFTNFELLIVDDGSKDGSGALCDKFAQKDSRVTVFHIPNGGMCHARNFAIDRASGGYIGFCDNDDSYVPDAFSKLAHFVTENPCDCLVYGRVRRRIDSTGNEILTDTLNPGFTGILKGEEIYEHFNYWCKSSMGVWCRLYDRAFLNQHHIRFNEELRNGAEDVLFNVAVISEVHTLGYLDETLYDHPQRVTHSTSMKPSQNRMYGYKLATDDVYTFMKRVGLDRISPTLFANRMVNAFVCTITSEVDSAAFNRQSAFEVYRSLYELYLPYKNEIDLRVLPFTTRTAFSCLMNKRWNTLYALTKYGTKLRRLLNLNLSL
jgi:glycosyltransferase involved in cell wall biosynthesis